MTLKSGPLAIAIAVVFLFGIGSTMAFNIWNTTSSKIPARISSGAYAGEADPADIRGSYRLSDIQESFAVPVAALVEAFGIQGGDPADFQVKGLEEQYGTMEGGEIGTDSVRWFVALYSGRPYAPEDDTLLPPGAAAVLGDRLSDAARAKIPGLVLESASPAAPSAPVAAAAAAPVPTVAAEGHETETGVIKGKTTFNELYEWGLSRTEVEQILGMKAGIPAMSVRDFASQNGLTFSEIKTRIQTLLDSKR